MRSEDGLTPELPECAKVHRFRWLRIRCAKVFQNHSYATTNREPLVLNDALRDIVVLRY